MRLFVACDPDEHVRHGLAEAVEAFRDRLSTVAGLRVRWVRPDQIHLTLRFLGEVDDGGVPALERALAERVPGAAFDLDLRGLGAFPERGRPTVLWAGIVGTAPLLDLHARVEAAVQAAGLPPEDRAYSPHLTIGRVAECRGVARAAVLAARPELPRLRWRVDEVRLVRSRLSPHGASHDLRLRIPLIE